MIITSLLLWSSACTIKPPVINITSEKTALENQMFGEKARISSDPSTSIAVWAPLEEYAWAESEEPDLAEYRDEYRKRSLTLAQVRRKTMSEYIYELKRQGILGETYDGRLVVMPDSIGGDNQIARIAEAENKDREIILSYYFESHNMEDDYRKSAARIEFAQVMARTSPDGAWIEGYKGHWSVK
jgi:uncharacterized protein YdbL (DUF1318 family)